MRSKGNVTYEKPAIQTVSAATLIEMVGPVQGYSPTGAGSAESATGPFRVGTAVAFDR